MRLIGVEYQQRWLIMLFDHDGIKLQLPAGNVNLFLMGKDQTSALRSHNPGVNDRLNWMLLSAGVEILICTQCRRWIDAMLAAKVEIEFNACLEQLRQAILRKVEPILPVVVAQLATASTLQ